MRLFWTYAAMALGVAWLAFGVGPEVYATVSARAPTGEWREVVEAGGLFRLPGAYAECRVLWGFPALMTALVLGPAGLFGLALDSAIHWGRRLRRH